MKRSRIAAVVGGAITMALTAPSAHAAITATSDGFNVTVTADGDRQFVAGVYNGGLNQWTFSASIGGPVTAAGSCTQSGSNALCSGPLGITVNMGAGDDYLALDPFVGSADNGYLAATLNGEGGNDFLTGGTELDTLNGGDGNDELKGQQAPDTFNGGPGADRVVYDCSGVVTFDRVTGPVTASIGAGSGDDGSSADGNPGSRDTIGADVEELAGTRFGDTLTGSGAADLLYGNCVIPGDVPTITDDGDVFQGLGGNDRIYTQGGADSADGGDGDDIILGGRAADTLTGGAGADSITGDEDNDNIDGGAGARDALSGSAGDDRIRGGAGKRDALIGGEGIDILLARAGKKDRDATILCGPGSNKKERAKVDRVDPKPQSC